MAAKVTSIFVAAALVSALAGLGTALAQAPEGAACRMNTDCSSGACNRATGQCTRGTARAKSDGEGTPRGWKPLP